MVSENSNIPVKFILHSPDNILKALRENRFEPREMFELRLMAERIQLRDDFDELLCLEQLSAIEKLWYQVETVRKTLKRFNGRVLLADEVGLGKTVEAGMIMKEYRLRGLADTMLILTPASLVSQWQNEMREKFDLEFKTPPPSDSPEFVTYWQKEKLLLCSINLAKLAKTRPLVLGRGFDLAVVDEAHHCKNSKSLNWQLVNQLQKRFMLLLTATPVQNNLLEIYNLITLLKPGQLSTEHFFKKNFVDSKDSKKPKQKEDLRTLLNDVMIRNTRSSVNIGLPKRRAHTFLVQLPAAEAKLYREISNFVRLYYGKKDGQFDRLTLTVLQQEAGSSPAALLKTLIKLEASRKNNPESLAAMQNLRQMTELAKHASASPKAAALLEILKKNPGEKILVFVNFQETLGWLKNFLKQNNIETVEFHGGLTAKQKDEAVEQFRGGVSLMLCTESGGEGRNLQFCNTMVNFDLPWNPMRIEQRIGRIHRFGQTREVFVFNLALKNSVEDYLLRVLDEKINMFELVVGEVDMILGELDEERDMEDIIMDIWAGQGNKVVAGFDKLGDRLIQAKREYLDSKELDKELFEQDYEV